MTVQTDAAPASPGTADVASLPSTPCPFCGILCDDLELSRTAGRLKIVRNGCARAVAGFERSVTGTSPSVGGKPVSLDEAVAAAITILRGAKLPLYGGLGTDVDGMRAVMSLADKSRGVVDHALSEGQFRNFKVLQTSGWFLTTLTECRNRADLFVIVASDVHALHPRFFERIVTPAMSMFADPAPKRDVVFLGQGLDQSGATGPRMGNVASLDCPNDRTGEIIAALRAIVNGTPLKTETVAGIPMADIRALADRIRAASYPVFVWAPPSLAFPSADLLVHAICELVKDLNKTQRAAGLSLGGNEGAVSAGAVCAWQSGYPLRVSYASGKPEYDPLRYAIRTMLEAGEGDCLVWLSTFTPDLAPPPSKVPLILIGTPGTPSPATPAVFIPVGTPGADHAGRIVRCDNVVSLPLRDLGRSKLPRAADILSAIEAAL
ncbi:MAG: formylmethanofuran dehydrogenase [Hyphomicrobium sp.]|nr:formylmethanofuran dehydrogenase [Hyphomicrobium sp.]